MTDGLSYQLWRLSEAGEPVVMLGRQHGAEEEAAFESLIQLGILVHRDRLSAGRFVASALIVAAIVQAEVTDPG